MTTNRGTVAGAVGPGRGGRMSRQRKRDAVLRLLRGEDLESVSRGLGVTAATLSGWRDAFLTAGEASLSTRPLDADALESGRLKAKLLYLVLNRSEKAWKMGPREWVMAKAQFAVIFGERFTRAMAA